MVNIMSKKETDLGRDSIGKLLFKLAMPAIIAQLVNVLYNIVDRMFMPLARTPVISIMG
ncbi:Na+ driven multidrug efflux pump [Clostridium perfringens]|nr:Na+ driven multidrug efflux pump [Clostridium perfringens]